MKTTKRLTALVLTLALVLSLTLTPAMAARERRWSLSSIDTYFREAQVYTASNGDGYTPYNLQWTDGQNGNIQFNAQAWPADSRAQYYVAMLFRDGVSVFNGWSIVANSSILSNSSGRGVVNASIPSSYINEPGEYVFLLMAFEEGFDVHTIYGEIAKSPPYIHGATQPPVTGGAMPGWSPIEAVTAIGRMVIKPDNSLWGSGRPPSYNSAIFGIEGELQNPPPVDPPVKIMDDVLAVEVSSDTSYVLKTDGSVWVAGQVWGDEGRVVRIAAYKKVMDDVASMSLPYFVKTDSSVWTWNARNSNEPRRITDGVIFATTGFAIRTDNSLWHFGLSGIGSKLMDDVASVKSSDGSYFAIKTDGSLWVWGTNPDLGFGYGRLGDGTTAARTEPVKIMDGVAFVHPLRTHIFAVKTDGTLWAWGLNSPGRRGPDEIGYGNFAPIESSHSGSSTPMHVMTGDRFAYAAERHAVKTDGSLWTWSNTAASPFQVTDGLKLTPPASPLGGGTTTPPPPPPADPLDSADTWAKDGITKALAKGFVPTDIQGDYKKTITRAEFCRMAVEWVKVVLGETDLNAIVAARGDPDRMGDTFSDTSDPNILAAYRLGITSGAGGGLFNPNGDFTREQAATMIMNTVKVIGANTANPASAGFGDMSVAAGWAHPGINFVGSNGIMNGDGTNFNPRMPFDRQQSIITFNNIEPDDLP